MPSLPPTPTPATPVPAGSAPAPSTPTAGAVPAPAGVSLTPSGALAPARGSLPGATGSPRTRSGTAPVAGARHATAQQRIEQTVAAFAGCLGRLPSNERRVLVLRAGLGAIPALAPADVARRLGLPLPRVRRLERRGIRALSGLGRTGACDAGPLVAGAALSGDPVLAAALGDPLLASAFVGAGRTHTPRSGVEGVFASSPRRATGIDAPVDDAGRYLALLILAPALALLAFAVRRELHR